MRLRDVTGIDGRTRSTDSGTEDVGEFADEFANDSSEPTPRPPETTFCAPRSSGREEVSTMASNESIEAARLPESATLRACVFSGWASARVSIAPRRTVMTGAPKVGADEAV